MIAVIGLSHRTVSVALREKVSALSFTLGSLDGAYGSAAQDREIPPAIDEMVVVSTCNRLEVYFSAAEPDEGIAVIEQFLAGQLDTGIAELETHLYRHAGGDAVRHLMCVACGLDSMIFGETQILGQIAQAFEDARMRGHAGPVLSRLFAQAVHTGKRAHTETTISRSTTSVSHAAAQLVLENLPRAADAKIVLIGAGEMTGLAARALERLGVGAMTFVNRTFERAEALAAEFGGTALPWSALESALVWADAVICATGAPHTVIYRRDLAAALAQRGERPLILMDIAVPRDIEDGVQNLPGIQYFDIDALRTVVDKNAAQRQAAGPHVEKIVLQESELFLAWQRGRQVTPVIRDLRDWAQTIADDELTTALNRLSGADERTREIVSRMAHRLVNRLLHEPTLRLRLQATEGNGDSYAEAVRELFALNGANGAYHDSLVYNGIDVPERCQP
jgi:glutamyl-tRNA reductase